jgi:hypothetical protein
MMNTTMILGLETTDSQEPLVGVQVGVGVHVGVGMVVQVVLGADSASVGMEDTALIVVVLATVGSEETAFVVTAEKLLVVATSRGEAPMTGRNANRRRTKSRVLRLRI